MNATHESVLDQYNRDSEITQIPIPARHEAARFLILNDMVQVFSVSVDAESSEAMKVGQLLTTDNLRMSTLELNKMLELGGLVGPLVYRSASEPGGDIDTMHTPAGIGIWLVPEHPFLQKN